MPSEVVLVQGTSIKISQATEDDVEVTTLPTMVVLDCIGREIQYQGGTSTEIDTTTLCSTAKEFKLGLEDPGTMSVNGHWKQGNPAHNVIRTAAKDKQPRLIDVEFEDGSVFRAIAMVSQRQWSAAVDGVVSAIYNFRLTGATKEVDPTP